MTVGDFISKLEACPQGATILIQHGRLSFEFLTVAFKVDDEPSQPITNFLKRGESEVYA